MEEQKHGRKPNSQSPFAKSRTISTPNSPFLVNLRPLPSIIVSDTSKRLEDVRIIQRTLVYVINLPSSVSDEETLSSKLYFGKYGNILKIHISPGHHNSSDPTYGAYLTYSTEEEAAICIRACNDYLLEGKKLSLTFGTTKYCSYFLKNMRCPKSECVFLHNTALKADTIFREDIINTKHIQPADSIFDRLKLIISAPIFPSKLPEVSLSRDRAASEIIDINSSPPQRSRLYSNHITSRYPFILDSGGEHIVEVPQYIEKLRHYASPCKDSAIIPSKDIEDLLSPLSPVKWANDILEVTLDHETQNSFVVTKKQRSSLSELIDS